MTELSIALTVAGGLAVALWPPAALPAGLAGFLALAAAARPPRARATR
jgi:hypothetical protein